jgi:hypothetical protein
VVIIIKGHKDYVQEIMPFLIFTTLLLLLIVFVGFFYYVCSLPSGCVYKGYFSAFFIIIPILLIFMTYVEKDKLNKSFNELIDRKVTKKEIKQPLDKQIHKLNNLKQDFDSITIEDATDRFCIVFKEVVSQIIGGSSNATYEEIIERVNASKIDTKLKHDLLKIFKFLMVIRYKDNKIDDKHLKNFIDYAINLANKYNLKSKSKIKHEKIKVHKFDLLAPIKNANFSKAIGIFLLTLVLLTGSLALSGNLDITGFSSYEISEGTSGSVTIHTIADQSVVEGHNLTISITANDSDSEDITFDIGDSDPSWVSISTISASTAGGINATGNITFSPASTGNTGVFNVTAIARSQDNDAAAEGLTITVTENTAPTLDSNIDNMTWLEDNVNNSYDLDDYFSDTEGDALSYTYSGNSNIAVSISDGLITLTPTANWNGSETITFTASDGIDTTDSNAVVMNVIGVYDAVELSQVLISPSTPNNDSDLTCSWYTASNDTDVNITTNVTWFHMVGSVWTYNLTETELSCTQDATCTATVNINSSDTNIADEYNCTVNVSDQNTTLINSINTTIIASAPSLDVLNISSNSFNRTVIGDNVTFNFTWSDIDGTNASIHVCNSSTANTSYGCDQTTFCSVNGTTDYSTSCNYTVLSTDDVDTNIWVFVCDDTSCSSGNASNFYINQPPQMYESYQILELEESAIVCAGDFDDDTYYNQRSYVKFNTSNLYLLDKVSINNASLTVNVTEKKDLWDGNITVESISNISWVSTAGYSELESMTFGPNANLSSINSTGNITLNITSILISDYNNNYTNVSYVFYNMGTNGTINDSTQATTFLAVGDNDTASTYGEMRFNETPYIEVNLTKEMPNYTWNSGASQAGPDLDDYFLDPDGHALNFTEESSENMAVAISDTTHQATFTPASSWYGTEIVTITATDASGENISANITLDVNYVASDTVSSSPSGGGGSSVRSVSLDLNTDDVELYSIDAKVTQLIVENDGDRDIEDIELNTLFPNVEGLTTILEADFIEKLPAGTNESINIKFTTYLAKPGRYNSTITGKAVKPISVSDSENFVIEIKEDDDESFFAKVRFVEDLFKTNPECLEYIEHIESAKDLYFGGSISKAHRILDGYVSECKDRITDDLSILDPIFKRSSFDRNKVMMLIGLAAISVLYIASLFIHSRE